ncbi:MAG: hypothetical protein WAX89_02680 [Alphaproteobacteria bacterium]
MSDLMPLLSSVGPLLWATMLVVCVMLWCTVVLTAAAHMDFHPISLTLMCMHPHMLWDKTFHRGGGGMNATFVMLFGWSGWFLLGHALYYGYTMLDAHLQTVPL